MELLFRYRRPITIVLHLAIIVIANFLAFLLRFDGVIPAQDYANFVKFLPWLMAIQGLIFIPLRLYSGLWRYTGIWDLRNIIAAAALSTALLYVVIWFTHAGYPRSVPTIDAMLLVVMLGGVRLTRRVLREFGHASPEKRVLIFGAGDAGELIARDMKNNPFYSYDPIGFIDDDRAKVGQRIHNIRVLGTRAELPQIILKEQPDEILIAMPRLEPAAARQLVKLLEPYKVPIKTLPNLPDIFRGKVGVSHIRSLSVEDLLPRAPVGMDPEKVRSLVKGKRVMITGAGGSIGSELCRQVANFGPSLLVMFERYENSLYSVDKDLQDRAVDCPFVSVIGDVTDAGRVDAAMAMYKPQVVFHAAAHKHVPLMEMNPCEAVKNNVFGTRTIALAARRHGIERFILISTDKAVNPTSVMGVTKRVAELLVLDMAARSDTCFMVVRFGNVLGSNGSVVPRFLEQIAAGGPVTVTHPEIRRFFMLIPEAVQLVLQAVALGQPGTIHVLEMGEQINIAEMARNLIRLAGFRPDEEIPIVYTGLRPGEKLFEELVGSDEVIEPSGLEKVLRVRTLEQPSSEALAAALSKLSSLAHSGDEMAVRQYLQSIVSNYRIDQRAVPADQIEGPEVVASSR